MSYLDEITTTEGAAAQAVKEAREKAAQAIANAQKKDAERISEAEAKLRTEAEQAISEQKKSLAKLYKTTIEEGAKEAQTLKASALGKRDRAIAKILSALSSL